MRALVTTGLALVVSAGAFGIHPHHHLHSANSQLRLAFPPIQYRSAHQCEVYERAETMENGGCELQCKLSGRLGSVSFSDSTKRTPHGLCMPAGQSCQIPTEMRAHYNTSSSVGRCTESCKCVPLTRKEMEERHRYSSFSYGYTWMHNHHQEREVKTFSELRKLPFEVSLPPPDRRNSEKCERFERQNWVWSGENVPANPNDQCKVTCVVRGNFGNVNIKLPERALNKNKPDGTRCYLKSSETEDIVSYGIKQSVDGKCMHGACIADGVKVMHFNHPTVTTTTTESTVGHHDRDNHVFDNDEDDERED